MASQSIAILYICTGKYTVFWKAFFESAEQFLLPDFYKEYFVFTDAKKIDREEIGRVHKIYQQSLPWPYPTLLRFKFFKSIESQLKRFDFIFFFNANLEILQPVNADAFLPKNNENGLVVTLHPGYWNKTNIDFPYDRNSASLACIPPGKGDIYVAGGLNGGRATEYLKFINICLNKVELDLKKNVIALWHDESYLNNYIIDTSPKVLHPGYLYPDGSKLHFDKIIQVKNKKIYIKGYGKYSLWHKLKNIFR